MSRTFTFLAAAFAAMLIGCQEPQKPAKKATVKKEPVREIVRTDVKPFSSREPRPEIVAKPFVEPPVPMSWRTVARERLDAFLAESTRYSEMVRSGKPATELQRQIDRTMDAWFSIPEFSAENPEVQNPHLKSTLDFCRPIVRLMMQDEAHLRKHGDGNRASLIGAGPSQILRESAAMVPAK